MKLVTVALIIIYIILALIRLVSSGRSSVQEVFTHNAASFYLQLCLPVTEVYKKPSFNIF